MPNRRPLIFVTIGSILVTLMACSTQTPADKTLENGSFTAELNGATIHYEVHGAGPVLMVLPNSWGINIAPLRELYRPLESRLTMVYFDPRGMGSSGPVQADADMGTATVRRDFNALREHLGLSRVNVIGWSNGAMNLILLASENPATIDKAVFLHGIASATDADNKAFAEQHPEMMKAYLEFNEAMKQGSMTDQEKNQRLRHLWLNQYMSILVADPAAHGPKVAEAFKECPFSWRHLSYSAKEWPKFDARDRLPQITAPSLILAGAKDSMPVAKAEEMKQGIRNSKLVIFEKSAHFAPLEEPEAFQGEVLSWLGAR